MALVRQTRLLCPAGTTRWLYGVIPERGLLLVTADPARAETGEMIEEGEVVNAVEEPTVALVGDQRGWQCDIM